jgi:hypothetical protein
MSRNQRFHMTKLSFLLASLVCLCCNSNKMGHPESAHQEDSITSKYLQILGGLKYDNVLYYREQKRFGMDLKTFGMPENDSIFKMDSAKYFESYQRFFQQDYHFVNWLLSFKNDSAKGGLWRQYLNPVSSHIGECHLPLSNSRAAIILLENFLNGNGFTCYECQQNDLNCKTEKYEEMEKFLDLHRGKDIDGLRKEWKARNR